MNKIKDWTDSERERHVPYHVKITNAIAENISFLSEEEKKNRRYYKAINGLSTYLEALDTADYKADGKGIFDCFKSDMKYQEEAERVKRDNWNDIKQCIKCSRCKCLDCTLDCPFKSCFNCNHTEHVFNCDKDKYCIIKGMPDVELICHDFGDRLVRFEVLGRLINKEDNNQYVLIAEIGNPSNSQLYRYVKYMNGSEDFCQMDSEEHLDKIYDIFVSLDCSDE